MERFSYDTLLPLRIELNKEEEYSFDEESLKEPNQAAGEDDDNFTPWSKPRMTRNSSKLSDQKSHARYAVVVETRY